MRNNQQLFGGRFPAGRKRKKRDGVFLAILCIFVMASTSFAFSEPAVALTGQSVCGLDEHAHTEDCYETVLVCGSSDESDGRTETMLVCSAPETPGHTHTEGCYIDSELVCSIEETESHTHDVNCYEMIPVTPAHAHTEGCYESVLSCGLEEHTHNDECYAQDQDDIPDEDGTQDQDDIPDEDGTQDQDDMPEEGGTQDQDDIPDKDGAQLIGTIPMSVSYESDLNSFLTSVVMKDKNGDAVADDDTVSLSETYSLALSFAESPAGLQFVYNNTGMLTYQLPGSFSVPTALSGSIFGTTATAIGEYTIATGGLITVKFYDVWQDGTATPGTNFIDNYSNAYFIINASVYFQGGYNGEIIDFGNGQIINFNVDNTVKLNVIKEAVNYDPTAKTIAYTITITCENGSVKNLVLKDTLDSDKWSFTDSSKYFIGAVTIDFNGTVKTVTPTITGGSYSIDLNNVYGSPGFVLDQGEKITVTYSLNLKSLITEADYVGGITNDATCYGTVVTSPIGESVSGADSTYTRVANGTPSLGDGAVVKTSSLVGDHIEYKITYEIPGDLHGETLWLLDELYAWYDPNKIDRGVRNDAYDVTVTANGTGLTAGTDYYFFNWKNNTGFISDYGALSWVILFNSDLSDSNKSLSPFTIDTTLVVTYKVPLSAPILTADNTAADTSLNMTLGELIKMDTDNPSDYGVGSVGNFAYLMSYDWTILDEDSSSDTWPIHKRAEWEYTVIGWSDETEEDIEDWAYVYDIWLDSKQLSLLCDGGNVPVFTDTFDSQLEYVEGSFNVYVENRTTGVGTDYGPYDKNWNDLISISKNGSRTTMSISFDKINMINWGKDNFNTGTDWYKEPDCEYYVYYTLKIKDKAKLSPYGVELDNTAKLTIGTTSFSDDCTVVYGDPVITKTMNSASNPAKVVIEINPNSADLTDATDIITVTDTMSKTLAFYVSTIKVEKKVAGNWVSQPITQSDSNELWSYKLVSDNELTFVLSDDTPIRLTYDALIKGAEGESVNVDNKVSVNGHYNASVSRTVVVAKSSASAGGSSEKIMISKYDAADTSKHLSGAVFALYADYQHSNYNSATPPDGVAKTFTKDGLTFYYVMSGTTDSNGSVMFEHQALLKGYGFVYALKEIKAPTGYALPAAPVMFYYDQSVNSPANATQVADSISISNISQTDAGLRLPDTGGSGVYHHVATGLLLIFPTVSLLFARKKRGRRVHRE